MPPTVTPPSTARLVESAPVRYRRVARSTRAATEVHHFLLLSFPNLGAQDLSEKLI